MTIKHGHDSGDERNPSVGYDKSDLSAKGILIFFLVLAVCTLFLNFSVLGMYFGMTRFAEKHDPEVSPLAPQVITPRSGIMTNTANINLQKFPEPRLQTNDTGDMTKFLVQETAALTAQPWQDAQGNAHLPIDQAMKAVAPRLPVRAGGAALPNYPGAGREYANPSAPDDAARQQDESAHGEVQNPPATPSATN
jgi:hypothetical protein